MAAPRNRIAPRDARVRGLGAPTPDDIAAHTERVRAHEKAATPLPKVAFAQVLAAEAQASSQPQSPSASDEAAASMAAVPTAAEPEISKPLPPWHGRRLIRG